MDDGRLEAPAISGEGSPETDVPKTQKSQAKLPKVSRTAMITNSINSGSEYAA